MNIFKDLKEIMNKMRREIEPIKKMEFLELKNAISKIKNSLFELKRLEAEEEIISELKSRKIDRLQIETLRKQIYSNILDTLDEIDKFP